MNIKTSSLFGVLPDTLHEELIKEYQEITTNYYEGKWGPAELSAGRFCEVTYTIIRGRADGTYPPHGSKPKNFTAECRALETETKLERGLRLLAVRILPALYEIRNNRDSGHIGGEVNSNAMDASFAMSASSWILSELIRIFHSCTVEDAELAVHQISEIRTPAIWNNGKVRRVLKERVSLDEKIILLVSSKQHCNFDDLFKWSECSSKSYLRKRVNALHNKRLIEASDMNDIHTTPKSAPLIRKLLKD